MLLRARVPPRLLYRAVTRLRPSSSALRKYSESSGPAQALSDHAGQAVAPAPNSYRGHCAPFPARTHTCAQLSAEHAGSRVVLTGWLLPPRKVGKGFFFFPLRDPYGTLQLVVQSDADSDMLALMRDIPAESTVLVEGTVHERPASQKRPHQGGDIEVAVTSFTLLNPADRNLPFSPSDTRNLPAEEYRLRYRYLDLRRPALSSNLQKRSQVAHLIRTTLHDHDFVEVETPILLKSTPEGAREFLVPTRITTSSSSSSSTTTSPPPPENGSTGSPTTGTTEPSFYALPQSPQQPKQLLIASGAVDRYYQIARCFRDEDGRKDRQPEFTQVDLEMAWVSWGEPPSDPPSNTITTTNNNSGENCAASTTDRAAPGEPDGWRIGGREVRAIVERMIRKIWARVLGKEDVTFTVLTYKEAMGRFGSDKPDVRFGLQLQDVTARLPAADRSVLSNSDEIVEGLVVHASDEAFSRAASQKAVVKAAGSDGVHTIRRIKGQTVATRSTDDILANTDPEAIAQALGLQDGDVAFLARRTRIPEGGSTRVGRLRLLLASSARALGDFTYPDEPRFLWVTEFPLFTRADEDKEFLAHGRWSSSHHPFTAPMWEDIGKMYDGQIAEVRGQHYDLVLNGTEIGGGSVRVHDAAMQEHIFKNVLQLDETERASFDHLLHALRCGAPPHGGIALGFDRLMAILCGAESIRDVIAFPKTGAGTDLLFKSPAPSTDETLKIYNLQARQSQ